jgi:hypothetical protein
VHIPTVFVQSVRPEATSDRLTTMQLLRLIVEKICARQRYIQIERQARWGGLVGNQVAWLSGR